MCHIRIMRSLSTEQRSSTGTALGNSDEMVRDADTFLHQLVLDVGHVVERSKTSILIVREDEDDVWPLGRDILNGSQGRLGFQLNVTIFVFLRCCREPPEGLCARQSEQ